MGAAINSDYGSHGVSYRKVLCRVYMDFASNMQAVRQAAGLTTEKFAEGQEKLGELGLKTQLLAEEARNAGDLWRRLDAKGKDLRSAKRELESKESALTEKSRDNGRPELEPGAARAAIRRRQRVTHVFSERLCTEYTSVIRVQGFVLSQSA